MSQDNVQDAIAKFKSKQGAVAKKIPGTSATVFAKDAASAEVAVEKVVEAHKPEEVVPEVPKRDVPAKTFDVVSSKMGSVESATCIMSMLDIHDYITYARELYDVQSAEDPTKELSGTQKEKAIAPTDSWQRNLDPKRASRDITPYLENPLHFFPPLICVVGSDTVALQNGKVTLTEHCLGALDGQHRLAGINGEIAKTGPDGDFAKETMPVVIIVDMPADDEGSDIGSRQQIFADVNRTPKTVSKAVNILFDHRDRYAGIAKGVAENFPGLVDHTHTSPSAKSSQFGSLTNIYNLCLQFGSMMAKTKNAPLRNGPDGQQITNKDVADVVTAVIESLPSFQAIKEQKVSYETVRGMYLCYSSTLFQAMGYELRSLLTSRNVPVSEWVPSVKALVSGTKFESGNPIWSPILKTSAKGKVSIGTRADDVTAAVVILNEQWGKIMPTQEGGTEASK